MYSPSTFYMKSAVFHWTKSKSDSWKFYVCTNPGWGWSGSRCQDIHSRIQDGCGRIQLWNGETWKKIYYKSTHTYHLREGVIKNHPLVADMSVNGNFQIFFPSTWKERKDAERCEMEKYVFYIYFINHF